MISGYHSRTVLPDTDCLCWKCSSLVCCPTSGTFSFWSLVDFVIAKLRYVIVLYFTYYMKFYGRIKCGRGTSLLIAGFCFSRESSAGIPRLTSTIAANTGVRFRPPFATLKTGFFPCDAPILEQLCILCRYIDSKENRMRNTYICYWKDWMNRTSYWVIGPMFLRIAVFWTIFLNCYRSFT